MAVPSGSHRGWAYDNAGRLRALFNGTEVFDFSATDLAISVATTSNNYFSSTLTGNAFRAPTGNVALGNPGAFATTQPQGAVIMGGTSLGGVAPVGAIATSAGIFASDTVVRKIIAAGTVSNVET